MEKCFQHWNAPSIPVRFFQRFDSAKFQDGVAASVGGIHAALLVFCCVKREMAFDFGGEIAIAAALAEKSGAAE
jgi:hypothetical protein